MNLVFTTEEGSFVYDDGQFSTDPALPEVFGEMVKDADTIAAMKLKGAGAFIVTTAYQSMLTLHLFCLNRLFNCPTVLRLHGTVAKLRASKCRCQ
jgi:hypothetical protein